jgi:hypothetical protein
MKWVKLKKYCQDTGDTSNAVHCKRKRGMWFVVSATKARINGAAYTVPCAA